MIIYLFLVKVVYPLKQGLKPFALDDIVALKLVKVVYPLKQGLKPLLQKFLRINDRNVKVVYPLKQGLKRQ